MNEKKNVLKTREETEKKNNQKSREPPNTAFRQQRLKSWQPILTPKSVIPMFFFLSLIFSPIGVLLYKITKKVDMINVDYTGCDTLSSSNFEKIPKENFFVTNENSESNLDFKWKFEKKKGLNGYEEKNCLVQFTVPKDLKAPLFLYYKLTNFYQNHRKYIESYDINQLRGKAVSAEDLNPKCDPISYVVENDKKKPIYPCGLIANSMFNDSFSNLKKNFNSETQNDYVFDSSGISWFSDNTNKFKKTKYDPKDIVPPPNWKVRFPNGYNSENLPDLSKWEQFHNWLKTAGLPSFYKLYGKNENNDLYKGSYTMRIALNYPVSLFGGTKSFVISSNSIIGGKNYTLSILYFTVSILCMILGVVFLMQHLIKPRKIGDHLYIETNSLPSITDRF